MGPPLLLLIRGGGGVSDDIAVDGDCAGEDGDFGIPGLEGPRLGPGLGPPPRPGVMVAMELSSLVL